LNELALFAGAGGGILGGHLLGWRTVCAVEWEAYPASVLCVRQNDGFLPPFPIWDDVQTFDGKPWRGIVDVVSGGFPCQDISAAGKGGGIEAERSGMWKEMARIIGEVRPQYAFVENSSMLTSRGLGTVLADLASLGLDAEWGVLSAADVGANHLRERIWIVAKNTEQFCNSNSKDVERQWKKSIGIEQKLGNFGNSSWWKIEPNMGRVADGVASRVDRLKAIGNGQVSRVAAIAWKLLKERLENEHQ
jgi:DNA (cytosine-5)-methyltransferase 1